MSSLPAASIARTSNVWDPSVCVGGVFGEEQSFQGPLSTRHSKVESGSVEWNSNVGVLSRVRPVGPESMIVSGPWVSTTKSRDAGEESVLSASSVARTKNVWPPSLSSSVVNGESQGA